MSLAKFSPPPSQVPMLLSSGLISPAWQQWFQLVQVALSYGTTLVTPSFSPGGLTNNVAKSVGSIPLAVANAVYDVNISVLLTLTGATFTTLTVQLTGSFTGNYFFSTPVTTGTLLLTFNVGPLYVPVPAAGGGSVNISLIAAFTAGTVNAVVTTTAIQVA